MQYDYTAIETEELIRWLGKNVQFGNEPASSLAPDFEFDAGDRTLNVRNLRVGDVGDPVDVRLVRIGPDNASPDLPRSSMRRVQDNQNLGNVYWQGADADNDYTDDISFPGRNVLMYARAVGAQTPSSMGGKWVLATTPEGSVSPLTRIQVEDDGTLDFGGAHWRQNGGNYELAIRMPNGNIGWVPVGPA